MEVSPVKGGLAGDGGIEPLRVGAVVRVNVTNSNGEGVYTFSYGGKTFQGRSDSPLETGAQRVAVLSAEPDIKISPAPLKDAPLFPGAKVSAEVISAKDGIYSVTINGKTYTARIEPSPLASKFIGEVLTTDPLLRLKPVFTSLKDITLPFMAKEMASFKQSDLSVIMKIFSGASLSAFTPDEIRRVIKDGGNFFENKLSRGIAPGGDVKMAAYNDDSARENITKMQIANILMADDFFSFFESDDLDFEGGIMRFRRSEDGNLNLYVKLDFTNLGETVVSFFKSSEIGYYVTVRTEEDISAFLSEIKVEGCRINWRKLSSEDKDIFNIKGEDLKGLSGLDIKI